MPSGTRASRSWSWRARSACASRTARLSGVTCTRTEYRGTRDAAGRKVPHDVPGSEFEIGLDTLILAISQHPVLDFFGERPPDLTPGGFIAVDPDTFETSLPGVYAGGDVAGAGPSSIVKAAADGKRVAAAIVASVGAAGAAGGGGSWSGVAGEPAPRPARRTCRRWWSGAHVASTGCRSGSATSTAATASRRRCWATRPRRPQREAGRCLDCDQICSLCVGVCPNVALMTYETAPVRAALPVLAVVERRAGGGWIHALRRGPASPGRRPDRLLQRVRQLRDGLPHLGQALPRQAAPLPGPGGLRGAGVERLHAPRRRERSRGASTGRRTGSSAARTDRSSTRRPGSGPSSTASTFAVLDATLDGRARRGAA